MKRKTGHHLTGLEQTSWRHTQLPLQHRAEYVRDFSQEKTKAHLWSPLSQATIKYEKNDQASSL